MSKSFGEIKGKAEALIEQGKEAEKKVQSCQARVVSANNRVAAARMQLAAASETDEEGNPAGDVEQARVQLTMAENQLAASQRALASASGDADRIKQQKNVHVQEIERHNQVERSNLDKLRKLRSMAFGADSAALTEGMAQRLNEAEDTRVALLRSMGIQATPDHVSVGGGGSMDSGWRGGGFAAIDTTGQAQSYQGGGAARGSIAAPVGGGLVSHGMSTSGSSISQAGTASPLQEDAPAAQRKSYGMASEGLLHEYADMVARAWTDSSMSPEERKAILSAYANLIECYRQQRLDRASSSPDDQGAKKLRKTPQQIADEGRRYINGILDAYRDNLLQRGVVDNKILDDCINAYRQQYLDVLNNDVNAGTFHLYDCKTPDFDELAREIKQRDLRDVERQLIVKHGASVVQLDGFDPRTAHDLLDALGDAKQDFPELNVRYFGSCQSQTASMRKELTDYFTELFAKRRPPNWTDQQFNEVVNRNVDHYIIDLFGMDDIKGTFAWSLKTEGGDPSNGKLSKYNGIAVNLEFAGDYERFKASKVREVNIKHKPIGCDSPRATLDHELGHEIDKILGAASDPVIQKLYWEMRGKNNAEDTLSGYSQKSIKEFIAEGYSEYRNNPHPRELSVSIFNRLIELRDMKAGGRIP